ncbi:L,D-transpeptidase family protein [Candidatus Odyssella thessalonicensis]|uniref:L,D-transpeptidase family protein n=1 Tax=Candidatus Odyssella thessalonicensis TaxID=84647 RepID=UPI000225B474|nr:L,D-transpeptidase family protein [Candidatus Odyssella thessalonicensis]
MVSKLICRLLWVFNLFSCCGCDDSQYLKADSVDRIVVEKSKRSMHLCCGAKAVKTYKIALGRNPVGHKQKQGDCRTPEGQYKISGKNPKSRYYKALRISYPNPQDLICAKKNCVNPGGDIMIHGLGDGFAWLGKTHLLRDWTQGCIAVTNEEMDEIFKSTQVGATIEIRP